MNPYSLAATSPSSWRVYLFRHLGSGAVNACNTVHKAKTMISPAEAGRQACRATSTSGTGSLARGEGREVAPAERRLEVRAVAQYEALPTDRLPAEVSVEAGRRVALQHP